MKNLLILLIAAAGLWSCNSVTDPAPNEPEIPSQVMQLVEKTYEDPQNIVFTEILKNKIWNVDLESKARKYSSVLTPENILASSRMMDSEVPDNLKSLMNPSFIAGGTFSNFRESEYEWERASFERVFMADYLWKGNAYLLTWRVTTIAEHTPSTMYTLEMAPVKKKFRAPEMSDLPDALQQYIQGKGYRLSRAIVSVDDQGKKLYTLYLHHNKIDFQLLFDEDSKLLAGSDRPVYLENNNALPEEIRSLIASDEDYKDFDFEIGINSLTKNEQDGVITYEIQGQKPLGSTGGLDSWRIVFDQNKKPVYREYYALYR